MMPTRRRGSSRRGRRPTRSDSGRSSELPPRKSGDRLFQIAGAVRARVAVEHRPQLVTKLPIELRCLEAVAIERNQAAAAVSRLALGGHHEAPPQTAAA